MKEPLYVLFKYGSLGVMDVQYYKIRTHGRIEWVRDKVKASRFKYSRAQAVAKGYRSVKGDDLVIEMFSDN